VISLDMSPVGRHRVNDFNTSIPASSGN
jgi:hypothetical protein